MKELPPPDPSTRLASSLEGAFAYTIPPGGDQHPSATLVAPLVIPRVVTREGWQNLRAHRNGIDSTPLSNIKEPITIDSVDLATGVEALLHALSDGDDQLFEKMKGEFSGFVEDNPDAKLLDDPKVAAYLPKGYLAPSHQKLKEIWSPFTQQYSKGLTAGISEGYLPSNALDRFGDMRKTLVRIADSAILKAIYPSALPHNLGDTKAVYILYSDEINLQHEVENNDELIENLAHESTHKISGGTFLAVGVNTIEFDRQRIGFSSLTKNHKFKKTRTDEAVVQHTTMGILTGDFETLDPDKRTDDNETYYTYRKVFASVVEAAQGIIKVNTITNAHFEDTVPGQPAPVRRKMVEEFVSAYGWGAIGDVEKLLELSDKVPLEVSLEDVLSRIKPPVIDREGNVISRGKIDVSDRSVQAAMRQGWLKGFASSIRDARNGF